MEIAYSDKINGESEQKNLSKAVVFSADDIHVKKIGLKMAENEGDRKKVVESVIDDIRPILDLEIIRNIIGDKNLLIQSLNECADLKISDEEFIIELRKIIDPLICIKESKPLEFGRGREESMAEEWGGGSVNEAIYYGIDKEKRELHIHVHTTKEKNNGKTVDILGQDISIKEKSKWLYDKLSEGLIKLRETAKKHKDEIDTITGDSDLVYKMRNTLEKKLGFKVELYETERVFPENSKERNKIRAGECSMGINEFLSQEFLDRIMEFRKGRGL